MSGTLTGNYGRWWRRSLAETTCGIPQGFRLPQVAAETREAGLRIFELKQNCSHVIQHETHQIFSFSRLSLSILHLLRRSLRSSKAAMRHTLIVADTLCSVCMKAVELGERIMIKSEESSLYCSTRI
jgi:hypothetical protein